jgi:hypothetical protein
MAAILHTRNWALLGAPLRFTLTNIFSSAEDLMFYKLEDNTVSPIAIIINTTVSANLTNPSYAWEYAVDTAPDTWIALTNTGSSLTVEAEDFETYVGTGSSVQFRVTASQVGRTSSTSITKISYYDERNDTVQVLLQRNSIPIYCDEEGDPTTLTGTGNSIQVSVNGKLLNYGETGPKTFSITGFNFDPAASVAVSGSGIGDTYTFTNLTSITSPYVTATATVSIRNALGLNREPRQVAFNYFKVIPGTDGLNAFVADLVSDTDTVFATNEGTGYTLPTGNAIRLYQGQNQLTTGVNYSIEIAENQTASTQTVNGLTASISSTGAITLSGTQWNGTQQFFKFVATYNSINYSKIYTITKARSGYDSVILDLYSEANVVATDEDGKNYSLPTGNYLKLYSGGVAVSTGVTYGPSTQTIEGVTATVSPSTGSITLSAPNNSWTDNVTQLTFTAQYSGQTYTAIYSLSKSKKGSSSVLINLDRQSDVAFAEKDGTGYQLPAANNNRIKLYKGGALLSSNVTYGPSTQTVDGLTATVSNTGFITITSTSTNSWIQNSAKFVFTANYQSVDYDIGYTITKSKTGLTGEDSILPDLYSETDVVYADEFGKDYVLPTVNNLKLYKGGTELTSGVTYGPTTQSSGGLTATINTTTGAIALSGANNSWTTDTATFTFTASYGTPTPTVYNSIYTISKSKKGSAAVFIDLGSESQIVNSNPAGLGYVLPTGNFVVLKRGGAAITTDVVYGPSSATQNGLTLTVNPSTGAIALSGSSWSTNTEVFNITAVLTNSPGNTTTYTTQYTITKGKDGATGASGLSGYLTNENYTLITDSTGLVYSLGAAANGGFKVFSGGTEVTASCLFSISGGTDEGATWSRTVNGLKLTLNETTGTYTLSGSPTWTSDSESFTLVASYNSAVLSKVYTIGKSKSGADGSPAKSVDLLTTKQTFDYNSQGTLTGTSTATLTATAYGVSGTVYYEFLDDGVTVQNTTTNTYPYTAESTFSNMPDQIVVRVRLGASNGTIVATDILTLIGLQASQSQVKGISFLRSTTQPTTPTGGSYSSPTATGWSDGIPSGNNPLWMTTRIFTSDGLAPQQGTWTTPQKTSALGDGVTAYFSDNGSTGWTTTASTTSQWMRIDTTVNGVVTQGTPVKIKGENGYTPVKGVDYFDGVNGTSVDIQYSANSTGPWSDTPVPGTTKYVRTGTKTPPATTFTYGAAVKFVPELGVEYTVTNGQTSYLHVKYSNDGGATFTANNGETAGDYLGTYVDFTAADSNSVSSYTWVKIKGEPGVGVPGTPGDQVSKVYIKTASQGTVPGAPSGAPPGGGNWSSTPVSLTGIEAQWESDGRGVWNGSGYTWSWSTPYLSYFKVNTLEAITINTGSLNVTGNIVAGTGNPALSGTAMSGSGAIIYSNGNFGFGNSTNYITWNGSNVTVSGDIVTSGIGIFGGSTSNGSAWSNANLRCGSLSQQGNPASSTTYGLIAFGTDRGVVGVADGSGSGTWGVFGQSFGSSGKGVYGVGSGTLGIGVTGEGNGRGVVGVGYGAAGGVEGTSTNGAGVIGISTHYIGVEGSGPTGVWASGTNVGVSANSTNGVGLAATVTGTSATAIQVNSASASAQLGTGIYCLYGSGNISVSGNVIGGASDIRLKQNIVPITDALYKVSKLSAFTYNYNDLAKSNGLSTTERFAGLSAQEVEGVLPEAVKLANFDLDPVTGTSKTGENYKSLQYDRIVPLLVQAIKELTQELEILKQKVGS